MPLTLGASHSLSSSGQVAIAAPTALGVHVTPPNWAGELVGDPPRFLHLGWFAVGTSAGWFADFDLVYLDQVFWPLPPGCSVLALTLAIGAAAVVDEFLGDLVEDTSIVATEHGYSLTVSRGALQTGVQSVRLTWLKPDADTNDYVAILPAGAAPTGWIDYWRLNSGTRTAGSTPAPAGSLTVFVNLAVGNYEWQIQDASSGVPGPTIQFPVT